LRASRTAWPRFCSGWPDESDSRLCEAVLPASQMDCRTCPAASRGSRDEAFASRGGGGCALAPRIQAHEGLRSGEEDGARVAHRPSARRYRAEHAGAWRAGVGESVRAGLLFPATSKWCSLTIGSARIAPLPLMIRHAAQDVLFARKLKILQENERDAARRSADRQSGWGLSPRRAEADQGWKEAGVDPRLTRCSSTAELVGCHLRVIVEVVNLGRTAGVCSARTARSGEARTSRACVSTTGRPD